MKNKIIIPVILLAIVGIVAYGTTKAYADDTPQDHMTSLIQKLVSKFGLKEDEVRSVFEEERKEHQAQMQVKMDTRLTQAVKDGKLTEDQKNAILAKHKELQAQVEQEMAKFQNMTQEERKTEMEKRRNELESWAKEKGIDISYLFGGFGFKGGGRGVRHMMP